MKHWLGLGLGVPFVVSGSAQYTEQVDGGVSQYIIAMHVDTLDDRVLLAGAFAYANDVQVSPGILAYQGGTLQSLGCGVEWDCIGFVNKAGLSANPSQAVTTWRGDVYVGGDWFFERDGVEYDHIMRWDGNAWHPLGLGCDGKVKSIRVINDQLIVAGWFTHADTLTVNGLARWDGEQWHRIVDVPPFYIGGGPNQLEDVNYFQDTWYIGGNLPLVDDLARWTGTAWEEVGGGFTSGFSQVNCLEVQDDRLYVAGSFARCPPLGNGVDPGNGVVAWDGANWDDLGGGTCGSANGAVFGITWHNGELYASGINDRMGGEPCGGLAKWNGTQWCPLVPQGYWGNGGPNSTVFFHDTLFIGGAFTMAGSEEASCFVRWTGGDHTEACGAITGIQESDAGTTITVFPSPTSTTISIQLPTHGVTHDVRILDAIGREVHVGTFARADLIDVSRLASGTYSVLLSDPVGLRSYRGRFIKH